MGIYPIEYQHGYNAATGKMDNLNKPMIVCPNQPTLVVVYANWCGYCESSGPMFKELSDDAQGFHVVFLEAINDKLVEALQLTGFPTMLVFRPPKLENPGLFFCKTERTLAAITRYVLSNRITDKHPLSEALIEELSRHS